VNDRKRDRHPTLEDDRAALGLDADDASPLVEGPGAPLAEDGMAGKPRPNDAVVPHLLLGGAPVGTVVPDEADRAPRDPMVAADDEPIGD
jgi:hypothetical protein